MVWQKRGLRALFKKFVIYMLIENLVTERSEVDSNSMMYRLQGKSSEYMKQLSKKSDVKEINLVADKGLGGGGG